jgi:hypothetical protein
MLFRTITGQIIEINKYDFKNDKLYYLKIMDLKNILLNQKKVFKTKIDNKPKNSVNI